MTQEKKKKKKIDLQIKIRGDLFSSNSNSIDKILTDFYILVQNLKKFLRVSYLFSAKPLTY